MDYKDDTLVFGFTEDGKELSIYRDCGEEFKSNINVRKFEKVMIFDKLTIDNALVQEIINDSEIYGTGNGTIKVYFISTDQRNKLYEEQSRLEKDL